MKKTALILFAHGARDPDWAQPITRVRQAVMARSPDLRIETAFLEFMAPSLRECSEQLVGEGFGRVVVVPMFIAQGGHLKRDVPILLDELRQLHPQVCFEQACPIGEDEIIVQAMAAHVVTLSRESGIA
jgi:sirohydrochlorin cobaltochelatase